jgi:hypothetical protein
VCERKEQGGEGREATRGGGPTRQCAIWPCALGA